MSIIFDKVDMAKIVRKIVSTEQPITKTFITRRIAALLKISRPPQYQEDFDSLFSPYYVDPLLDETTMVYWENEKKSREYSSFRVHSNRDIADIPIIEVE